MSDVESRLRKARQRENLKMLARSWKGLIIVVVVIALLAFGISYTSTPFMGCVTSDGTVRGERITQSSRGDFPRRVLAILLDDGRVVEVSRSMSETTRIGARAQVESCRKVVWSSELSSHNFKGYVAQRARPSSG